MSRHGYTDDYDDNWALIRWRGAVTSALRGKRGQKMLRDLATALDAMPEKKLTHGALQTADGSYCALGALARYRGLDVSRYQDWDPDDLQYAVDELAEIFDVAQCLVREVTYENDDTYLRDNGEQRWRWMRRWVDQHLVREAKDVAIPGSGF